MKDVEGSSALSLMNMDIETMEVVDFLRITGRIREFVSHKVVETEQEKVEQSKDELEEQKITYMQEHSIRTESGLDDYLTRRSLNRTLLFRQIARPIKAIKYRRDRWGKRVDSIYMRHKDDYDKVSYRQLASGLHSAMQEVFFRLKDGEASWPEMAAAFNVNGMVPVVEMGPVPVASVNATVLGNLRKLEPGEVAKPFVVDNQTVVVELVGFSPSRLDRETEELVLRDEFDRWISSETDRLMQHISFGGQKK